MNELTEYIPCWAFATILWLLLAVSILRWAWRSFFRDFFIIMLPPRDDPRSAEMESMFETYDDMLSEEADRRKGRR